tara:strand:+ start:4021 stop:4269 length:249 start_codon:yes stop_codon:yes gene_type:complete
MDKPSKIDLYVNKLEERQREHYERKVMLIKKIKAWLKSEIADVHANPHDDDVDSRELGILDGRYECARGLITQIKKWENDYE